MVNFFIRRPVFATVCSLLIVLAGATAIPTLPIAEYPNLTPPTVSVSAFYTGANSQAVETSVTTLLEQAINGAEGMRYMSSTSGNDGTSAISATFDLDAILMWLPSTCRTAPPAPWDACRLKCRPPASA